MKTYPLLAESFRYPIPGLLEVLEHAASGLTGDNRQTYFAFLKSIQKLSLAAWEELYTRTWDINPVAAPYVGYQIWGENYQRGNFMAALNRELLAADVDCEGELPDHLIPVLRYLGAVSEPLPELLEILPTALERIAAALEKADADNPYLHLLESIAATYKHQVKHKAH